MKTELDGRLRGFSDGDVESFGRMLWEGCAGLLRRLKPRAGVGDQVFLARRGMRVLLAVRMEDGWMPRVVALDEGETDA